MSNLEGKEFLITGATSGIGKATALWILNNTKASLYVIGRSREKLESIYSAFSTRCHIIVYNLEDIAHISNIFDEMDTRLDGFFHSAGISPLMKVEDNDVDVMRSAFNINVLSFIELCKYFYKETISNENASVVAMSSIATSVASFRQTVYSGSKAALEQSVRCIAKEFLPRGIRVNGIAAGAVETEMLQKLEEESEGLREKFLRYYPLGLISAEEIAKSVVYLLSDESKHIDGTILRIDSAFFINK